MDGFKVSDDELIEQFVHLRRAVFGLIVGMAGILTFCIIHFIGHLDG